MARKATTVTNVDVTPVTVNQVVSTTVAPQHDFHATFVAALTADGNTFPAKHVRETSQTYIKRVLAGISKVSPETWNELPIVAQNWYNEAVDAWTTGATIPNLPGYVEVREKQAERLADGRARAPERAPRGSKVKVEKQPRTASKTQILQRHIIANVGESKEAYAAFASTLELKTSTANMYRMLVLNVLKYAEEAGWERPTTSAQLPDDAEEEGDLEEVGAEAA